MDVDKTYTNRSNIVTLFIETCTLVYPSGYVSAGDALRSRSDFDASTSCGPPLRAFTFPLTPVGDLTSISGPYRQYEMPAVGVGLGLKGNDRGDSACDYL